MINKTIVNQNNISKIVNDYTIIEQHDMFKNIVVNNTAIKIAVINSDENNGAVGDFINHLVMINPYMFFTLDNITGLTNYINEGTIVREFILNLTDIVILDYIGNNGNVDDIIKLITTTVYINKNKGSDTDDIDSYRKLYDVKLAQSLYFNTNILTELLENNSFIIVLYYLCMYSHELNVHIQTE